MFSDAGGAADLSHLSCGGGGVQESGLGHPAERRLHLPSTARLHPRGTEQLRAVAG